MHDEPTYAEAERRMEQRIIERAARVVAGKQTPADDLAVTREWLALAESAEAEAELCEQRAAAAAQQGDLQGYETWTQGARTQRGIACLARKTAGN